MVVVENPQPLTGLLVVDLSEGIAGPHCTKLLADFGARVVKVESLTGDPARAMGPFPGDQPDPECSGLFLHLNTNKESVALDLGRAEGVEVARRLVAGADVVVESSPPGRLAALGLGPEELLAERPALVVTSITPFGQTGPYRDWDMTEIVAFAMGGMSASGVADREPVKLIGNVVLMQSGATACTATLGALFHAEEHGEGQHVDVATFETQNGSLDRRRYYLLSYAYSGTVAERAVVVGAGRPAAGGRFECADGRLVTTGRIWPDHVERMVEVLGDTDLAADWERLGLAVMSDEAEQVNRAIARWATARPSRTAMREAQAAGWPVVVVNDPLLLLDDDHLRARGFWVTANHPVAGELTYSGAPFRIDGGGWALRRTAPTLGQDTDRVLAELAGLGSDEVGALRHGGVVA
jgi:crotonobetainyl-CoA:carnitine CoA-transferase CaiB-like acyl-CoA transferase